MNCTECKWYSVDTDDNHQCGLLGMYGNASGSMHSAIDDCFNAPKKTPEMIAKIENIWADSIVGILGLTYVDVGGKRIYKNFDGECVLEIPLENIRLGTHYDVLVLAATFLEMAMTMMRDNQPQITEQIYGMYN